MAPGEAYVIPEVSRIREAEPGSEGGNLNLKSKAYCVSEMVSRRRLLWHLVVRCFSRALPKARQQHADQQRG
jgi:hypothetical protein